MSTGDGEGPEQDPPAERRRPTPPPGRRTPPPRTRSGDAGDVEHRSTKPERRKGSLLGRMMGRQGLDEALQERFKPYEYQSTRPFLKWLLLSLLVFVAAAAYALLSDFQFRSQVNEWSDEGFTEIPIDNEQISSASIVIAALRSSDESATQICAAEEEAVNATPTPDPENPNATPSPPLGSSVLNQACRSMERVFEHAVTAGIDCKTPEDFQTAVLGASGTHAGCDRLISLSRRYDSLETASTVSTVLLVFALIVAAFPFSSFAHRTSRNLLTLKSKGQKHSPDGAVIRFFVPVLNIYKPLLIFIELFKASDPQVPDSDPTAWRSKGRFSPLVVLWGIAWGAVAVFNPITIQFFYRSRDDLGDVSSEIFGSIMADILLILLGVLAILMSRTLSRWQDARAARYGTVTVTPVQPRDSLEKALEEGAQRQDGSKSDSAEKNSKRRKR